MDISVYIWIGIIFLSIVITFVLSWYVSSNIGKTKIKEATEKANNIVKEAEKEAQTLKKEKLLEVKDEWYKLKQKFENETKGKKHELEKIEKAIESRESSLERRAELLSKSEKEIKKLEMDLVEKSKIVGEKEKTLNEFIKKENEQLEKISHISSAEAKKLLMDSMVEKAKRDSGLMVKEILENTRLAANKEAKEIIVSAIQRSAVDHTVESTVSVLNIPNEEMKGRIIGRDGRNIRAFETVTGVEVIVDDTPEAVVLSAFDPVRREIARMALEKLIEDGRIHPARIEDIVEKTKKEMEDIIVETGEQALVEAGVPKVHPELIKLIGKLKYRTSYGQNVLQHSIEVAHLAGLMAASLGLDANLAKRAGLLHDIGKAIDRYTEGTHSQIGVEIAKRYHEGQIVLNAIEGHHEDVIAISPITVLIQAADSVSSSRPGARRATLEGYIKRLEQLEKLAESFKGVSKTYAIQAGREIRVIVEPEKVDDLQAFQISQDIAQGIEKEMEYPGQVKVTVIREYRSVSYAK